MHVYYLMPENSRLQTEFRSRLGCTLRCGVIKVQLNQGKVAIP